MKLEMEQSEVSRAITNSGVSTFMRQALSKASKTLREMNTVFDEDLLKMSADALMKGDTAEPLTFRTYQPSKSNRLHIGVGLGDRHQRMVSLPKKVPDTFDAISGVSPAPDSTGWISTDDRGMSMLWLAAILDRTNRLTSGRSAPEDGTLYGALQELFEPYLRRRGNRTVTHRDFYHHLAKVVAGKAAATFTPAMNGSLSQLATKINNVSRMHGMRLDKAMRVVTEPYDWNESPVDPLSDVFWQMVFRGAEHASPESLSQESQGTLIGLATVGMAPDGRRGASTAAGRLWLALNGFLGDDDGYKAQADVIATTTPGNLSEPVRSAFRGVKKIVGALKGAGFDAARAALHFRVSAETAVPSIEVPNLADLARFRRGLTGMWAAYAVDHDVRDDGKIVTRMCFVQDGASLRPLATAANMKGLKLGGMTADGNILGQARQLPSCEITSRVDGDAIKVEDINLMGRFSGNDALAGLERPERYVAYRLQRGFPLEVYLRLKDLAEALSIRDVELGGETGKMTLEPEESGFKPTKRMTLAEAKELYEEAGFPLGAAGNARASRFRYKGIPARIVIGWDETRGWTLSAATDIPVRNSSLELGIVEPVEADALSDLRTVISQQEQYGKFNRAKMDSALGRVGPRAGVFFRHVTVTQT